MSQVSDHHKLRYEDYVQFPDDGLRHEVLDGVHTVNPAPNTYHQLISSRLHYQLYAAIQLPERGAVFSAPIDVQLAEFDIVQPDLVVVLTYNRIVTPSKIKGTPDLIIEILSDSTRSKDRTDKRAIYEAAGVPEYWIVDPDEHEVEQLVLTERKFVASDHGEVVRLTILDDVAVNLAEVW